jgi:hypothetical protein
MLSRKEIFMTHMVVHRIGSMVLAIGLCAIFLVVALALNAMFDGVSPAHEALSGSGSYGEFPPVW